MTPARGPKRISRRPARSSDNERRGLCKKPSGDGLLSQGVTTIVVGQDGGSRLPIGTLWQTLEKTPVAVNVASYSGHNTIRSKVLGKNYRRVSTPQEIAKMAELLAANMRDGSLGLSSGRGYDPGIYADIGELVELGKVTAPYGGRYISHIRNENVTLWKSIGSVRRELLDHVPFWGARDLERKLRLFRDYYNHFRVHASLKGVTPICSTDRTEIALDDYRWRSHCRGLYQLPAAA